MRIVHFSNNSLAGAVLPLVRALNEHGGHQARLVDARRYTLGELGWFEHDLVFEESPEEAVALAESADVIHLHNFLDQDSEDFRPIDFRALRAGGTLVLRHFHSLRSLVAARTGRSEQEVLDEPLPSLVVGHCAERTHPRSRVVPNLMPIHDPAYRPARTPSEPDVVFSPSKPYGAWEERWNGKGMPETSALLDRVARATGCTVRILSGRPRGEVLQAKAAARVVIDDLVNGTLNLSALEGMSLGRATATFLDPRQERVLAEMTGASGHPLVNLMLEQAGPVLERLMSHPDEADGLGLEAREWMERRYDPARLVEHYLEAYGELEATGGLSRQPALALDTPARRFFAVELPEMLWQARARRAGGG